MANSTRNRHRPLRTTPYALGEPQLNCAKAFGWVKPRVWTVVCTNCQTEVEVEEGTVGECGNCGVEIDDRGNIQ